jgi:hypothetical protein
MPEKYTIGGMNRLLTIQRIAMNKNEKGLPIKLLLSQQTTFAYFQQVSNSYTLQQMQVAFGEAWEAVVRYEPSRIISPNDIILYNGKSFTINGIWNKDEGNQQWSVIRCAINNKSGATSGGEVMRAQKEFHLKGDGIIGGVLYANWTGTIMAYRDGIQFTVKRDGSAQDKEINYDASTGLFTYPLDLMPLQPNEPTDIYFL